MTTEGSERDAVADALGSSRLGSLDPSERPSAAAILGAMGGVRGLVESILPGVLFLVLFTTTRDVWLSVLAPLGISVAFVLARVLFRGQSTLAFAGLIGVGVSAAIALFTGDARDNFLVGFAINAAVLALLIGSLAARRPLIGIVVGGLTSDLAAWRHEPAKRTIATRATWLWVAVIGARLLVQVPLYLANAVEALGALKLVMGLPLYALALWVTWLMVRTVTTSSGAAGDDRRKVS